MSTQDSALFLVYISSVNCPLKKIRMIYSTMLSNDCIYIADNNMEISSIILQLMLSLSFSCNSMCFFIIIETQVVLLILLYIQLYGNEWMKYFMKALSHFEMRFV
jgi:hypothetical protein